MWILCLYLVYINILPAAWTCCLPDVFQTVWHITYSSTVPSESSIHVEQRLISFWFDYNEKISALKRESEQSTMKFIQNYNEKKEYVIENMGTESEKCTVYDITDEMERACLPAEAIHYDTVYYGIGDDTISVDRYQFMNEQDNVTFWFNMEKEHCVPVDRGEYQRLSTDDTEEDSYAGGTFLDTLLEIADREELVPPEQCQPGVRAKETKPMLHFPALDFLFK